MNIQKISEAEYQVMQVLWQEAISMTSAEIIEKLKKTQEWKPSTVWTFLGRLVEKNMLATEKQGRTNYYKPVLSKAEYLQWETTGFLEEVHQGSLASLMVSLNGGKKLTAEEINELKQWLESL